MAGNPLSKRELSVVCLVTTVMLPASTHAVSAADTRLADAVMRKDSAAVRSLLAEKVDVNAPEFDGTPALLGVLPLAWPSLAR